jgi:4-amino-4-deoxy-L-arabinose transferase-like glycosyltransferase
MKDKNKLPYYLLLILALTVNFAGINVPLFTDDQGLYASIAKNMVCKKDVFQLFTYNHDWLDKPHFPFWVISISFKLFGISVWAYRLPALLFFILSLVYTYLFSKKYYGREIAMWAVLILMTALNTQLSNTDVRAEPYLMALIIGSIYHISLLDEKFTRSHLFFAALLTAFAIMTKGIFVLTAIYGGTIGHLLFNSRIKSTFKLRWLSLLLLTFLLILPELYALYLQFDLHPEKTVFGTHKVSGIKWFLWDSQFGRFINNGPISRRTSGSIFFYLHTLLWAFAPWCLLFYYALYKAFSHVANRKKLKEYYTLSGALLLFLLFSLSKFQLPFYTNAIFPLFAIVTAPFCYGALSRTGPVFRFILRWLFVILLPCAVIILNVLLKPANNVFFIIDGVILMILVLLIVVLVVDNSKKAFLLNCAAALFAGLYVNCVFYNEVSQYNGQIAAARYINQKPFDRFAVYSIKDGNNIFQFYSKKPVNLIDRTRLANLKTKEIAVFYVDEGLMDYLLTTHAKVKVIKSFVNYPQENILPNFIWKANRYKVLDHVYLITNLHSTL